MLTTMLKSKLHRVKVTGTNLMYEGSCAIDVELMREFDIYEYEQIHIYNINNGNRFITYAIKAPAGSKAIFVNGACARLACVGDEVIICTYGMYDENELINYSPKILIR